MFQVILFDLDETLYPRSSSLMSLIGNRIEQYVAQRTGLHGEQAVQLRKHWRVTYGTALRGMLEEGYTVDKEDYLHYVHDIPLDGLIEPQPEVRRMLLGIPLRRVVLTNSNIEHATRVLIQVNLLDCFERIIDLRALNFINKPDPNAYRRAFELLGISAQEAILVEDTAVNTKPAKALGVTTILVDHPATEDANYSVTSILDVGGIVKQLLATTQQGSA